MKPKKSEIKSMASDTLKRIEDTPMLDKIGGMMKENESREYISLEILKTIILTNSENYKVNDGYFACQPLVDDSIRITDELIKQLTKNKEDK